MSDRPRGARDESPRDRAVRLLLSERDGFLSDALDEAQRATPLSAADAGLAYELTLGVERHRLTLQRLLAPCLHGAWTRIDPRLRAILLVAAYQLAWLDRVPAYAAVDQAVEQARRFVSRKAAGLVNAVLRTMQRLCGPREPRPAEVDPRHWVTVDFDAGLRFGEPVFPDPAENVVQYLAQSTSHPAELVTRWVANHGRAAAEQACRAGAARPPLVLRPNRLRIGGQELAARLRERGIAARCDAETGAVELARGVRVDELPEFQEGLCQPQDATAQAVWQLRPPEPGERVLDLCAGAGTKATHAAEWMQDCGVVAAQTRDAADAQGRGANAKRLGLTCVRRHEPGAIMLGGSFDLILLDVPCSNSGTLARRPEARYRFAERRDRLTPLTRVQDELLDQAVALAGRQTELLYSTCSIEPEENEARVAAFCEPPRRLAVAGVAADAAAPATQTTSGATAALR
ncbi:MAG: transcription antitermination factor NusB [Phycisphaerae bacterium]